MRCTCLACCATSGGDHSRAVELIRRAVALQPSIATFHANLGEAYRALKQFDRAVGSCRAALR